MNLTPKKQLIIAIVFLLAPFILEFAFLIIPNGFISNLNSIALSFSKSIEYYLGINYIYTHSTIAKTIYKRIIYICFSIFIIAILAKLQHWSWSGPALIISISSMIITYIIRFILKKKKAVIDILKLFWVITFSIYPLFKLQHYSGAMYFLLISETFFIILLFYYLHEEKKQEDINKMTNELLE